MEIEKERQKQSRNLKEVHTLREEERQRQRQGDWNRVAREKVEWTFSGKEDAQHMACHQKMQKR